MSTAVIAILLVSSAALAAFRCDENCYSDEQATWWGYEAQFYLAGAGALLGVVALTFGFTTKKRTYWTFAVASTVCWVTWFVWVSSGNF